MALTAAAFMGGCAAVPPAALGRAGGEARLRRVVQLLEPGVKGRVSIDVSESDEVTAFAWPDGRVVVTRGLMNCLPDDAELAAAVAHELGHLLGDRHLESVVSLRGGAEGLDCEARADAVGVQLLEAQSLPGRAMESMLRKVRAAGRLEADRAAAIDCRISRLAARAGL